MVEVRAVVLQVFAHAQAILNLCGQLVRDGHAQSDIRGIVRAREARRAGSLPVELITICEQHASRDRLLPREADSRVVEFIKFSAVSLESIPAGGPTSVNGEPI